MGDLAREWLKVKKATVKHSTAHHYEQTITSKHFAEVDGVLLGNFGFRELQDALSKLPKNPKTFNNIATVWRQILEYGFRAKLLAEPLHDSVEIPGQAGRTHVTGDGCAGSAASHHGRRHARIRWGGRQPYTTTDGPLDAWWKPAIASSGLRYRDARQTRHTFATICLMGGITPGWVARQMGHSPEMFFRVYSRWIEGEREESWMRSSRLPLSNVRGSHVGMPQTVLRGERSIHHPANLNIHVDRGELNVGVIGRVDPENLISERLANTLHVLKVKDDKLELVRTIQHPLGLRTRDK